MQVQDVSPSNKPPPFPIYNKKYDIHDKQETCSFPFGNISMQISAYFSFKYVVNNDSLLLRKNLQVKFSNK